MRATKMVEGAQHHYGSYPPICHVFFSKYMIKYTKSSFDQAPIVYPHEPRLRHAFMLFSRHYVNYVYFRFVTHESQLLKLKSHLLQHIPHPEFSLYSNKLTSFIVFAMMALLGCASPALLASDTASPNGLKQGSGVNSITWCTFVTSRPCSRYHLRRGVANRILSPFMLPIKLQRG